MEAKGKNGTVSFDGKFVTITRSGLNARMTVGKGEKRIPITSIHAVQWKPPGTLVRGYLAFTVPGGIEKQSRLGKATIDAAKDENAVIVGKREKAEFLVLRNEIEEALAARM